MTSRELVNATLKGENYSTVPRHLWVLPVAIENHKMYYEKIISDFPPDIVNVSPKLNKGYLKQKGNPYDTGEYIDEWGCVFENIQKGIIGEVKTPLILDDEWSDEASIHIPYESLSFDIERVNKDIEQLYQDKFVIAGAFARPFEQLQFIRGTENFYVDLLTKPEKMMNFIKKMHQFYCELLKKWAQTDVDALMVLDDWGSQNSLLISPLLWEEIFMPMYKDYIDIAHAANKKLFMNSDGNIIAIIPKLIELGLDALNCQIFCIGIENLKKFRGKITFWGEIDRQYLLPFGTKEDIAIAVTQIKENLWKDGYCIAQLEFGAGAKPQNVYEAFKTWNTII